MGADSLFQVKTIETHARAFLTLNILAIGRVCTSLPKLMDLETSLGLSITINRVY